MDQVRVAVVLYLAGASVALAYSLPHRGLASIIPWVAGLASLLVARAYGSLAEGIIVGGVAMLVASLAGMEGYSLGAALSLVAFLIAQASGWREVVTVIVGLAAVSFLGAYSLVIVSATGDEGLYRVPIWITVTLLAVTGAYMVQGRGDYGGLSGVRTISSMLYGLARRGSVAASLLIMGLVTMALAAGRNGLSLVLAWLVFIYSSLRWGPVRGVAVVLIALSLLMYLVGVGHGFAVIDSALGR